MRCGTLVRPLLGGPFEQVRDRLGSEAGPRADDALGATSGRPPLGRHNSSAATTSMIGQECSLFWRFEADRERVTWGFLVALKSSPETASEREGFHSHLDHLASI